jgi:hypothetical protein
VKNKLLLGIGIATGYVLGSRSGRAAYDKLKARAAGIWDSKPVQDKVHVATDAIKEKAPEVADQLTEAARRAGTVLGSAMHREGASGSSGNGKPATSDAGTSAAATASGTGTGTIGNGAPGSYGTAGTGTSGTTGTSGNLGDAGDLGEDHIPAHSTHPETTNLGTTSDEGGSKA